MEYSGLVDIFRKYDNPFFTEDYLYLDSVYSIQHSYISKVSKYLNKENLNLLNNISSSIFTALQWYLSGDIIGSANKISDLITSNQDYFLINKTEYQPLICRNSHDFLYRGRTFNTSFGIDRTAFFHIPFEKRSIVSSQRFSIPGVPCLYLGGSLYIIWLELNKPSFNDFYVSRFKLNSQSSILDLAINSFNLKTYIEENIDSLNSDEFSLDIAKIILTKLLSITCSLKIRDTNRSFKIEYVIPQLIMSSLVRNKSILGIRYFSSYSSSIKANIDEVAINYAFPAKPKKNIDSYSSGLMKFFECSSPSNIDILEKNPYSDYFLLDEKVDYSSLLALNVDHYITYNSSNFYKIQCQLNKFKTENCCNFIKNK